MDLVIAAVLGGVVCLAISAVRARSGAHRGRAGSLAGASSPAGVADSAPLVAMLERLPIGIVLCDRSGAVTYRNSTARTLAGTHAGVLLDETLERHLASATLDGLSEEVLELYGPPKMVLVVRASALDRGGAFAFVEDISERRRIDSIRTDFVANISHELKTPVGALAVLAETLADEPDADMVAQLAERLLAEAHRAAHTIDDLLELSRIELGGEPLDEESDAEVIVRTAIDRAAPLAQQRGIEVSATVQGPIRVAGDRRQLVSAVGNLVENAVKYSESGGSVQVTARYHEHGVEFVVADHGVGIPARDLDRIFERFYRVDKARSRGTGGSGLGLAIVRHVATNHAGEVTVASTEGQGSTFTLRIPGRGRPAAPVTDTDNETDTGTDTAGDIAHRHSEEQPVP